MGFRTWLGLRPVRRKTLESAFDPVDIAADARIPVGFREFTLPPRLQRGTGPLRQGGLDVSRMKHLIVPDAGVKVP